MNSLLIAFEVVLLVPLFVATWRTSLLGLSCQGLLLGWFALRHGFHAGAADVLTAIDLIVVRGVLAPLALYRVMRQSNAPQRNDVIPPNLLSWTAAAALVFVAFRFADAAVAGEEAQTLVAVSTSAFLLGLLVLSTRSGVFSQIIGALRIENAIALFELGGEPHQESLGIRAGLLALVVLSIGMFRWYLLHLSTEESPPGAPEKVAP